MPRLLETLCPCSGDTCAEDDAECTQLDPCLNGATCVDLPNNYTCECPDKYSGRNCELDLDMYVELVVAGICAPCRTSFNFRFRPPSNLDFPQGEAGCTLDYSLVM